MPPVTLPLINTVKVVKGITIGRGSVKKGFTAGMNGQYRAIFFEHAVERAPLNVRDVLALEALFYPCLMCRPDGKPITNPCVCCCPLADNFISLLVNNLITASPDQWFHYRFKALLSR